MKNETIKKEENGNNAKLLLYGVLRIDKSMEFLGVDLPLPKGQYVMPIFEDMEEAVKCSQNGKFKIVTFETIQNAI